MSILKEEKYVLFTFPDDTHLVVRTSLNLEIVPDMQENCVYDLDTKKNIPVKELDEADKKILDVYPEEFREESDFYKSLRYGV